MRRFLSSLLSAAAMLAFHPGSAAANDVADGITKASRKLYMGLYQEGFRNVGVIAFEAQKETAKGPIPLRSGRLPETASTTLENSMILITGDLDKKKNKAIAPLGIVRGAWTAAQRAAQKAGQEASFSRPEDRVKLFAYSYPLAWGDKDVQVDALLAGKVLFAADDKTFEIKIYSFTKAAPEYKLVFSSGALPATAAVFQDAQRSFVVKARGAGDSESSSSFDVKATDNAAKRGAFDDGKVDAKGIQQVDVAKPEGPAGQLEFKILYGGQPVAITKDVSEERIPFPATGQTVEFRVKAPVRMAVILLVNGVNTANFDQKTNTTSFSKWVLEPGVEYAVTGFYDKTSKLIPFGSVDKSDTLDVNSLTNPDKLGVIELQVFEELSAKDALPLAGGAPKVDAPNSLREVTSSAGKTLDDLVDEITKPVVAGRDVIVPDLKNAVQANVETAKFEAKPVPAINRVIRYLDSGAKPVSTKPLIDAP